MTFSATTHNIKVTAKVIYQPKHSQPALGEFVFAYTITIENLSDKHIQLLSRKWHIVDSYGLERFVEGDGVVGRQPSILPNAKYSYISGCHLNAPMGKMFGTYTMKRLADDSTFEVEIPIFYMQAPVKLN